VTTPTLAMPDLLGRVDTEHGPWAVAEVAMAPGESWTNISARKMQVPKGDTALERFVRAHEMMHAKVSPDAKDSQAWFLRGRASLQALISAEEFRVNTLVQRAGFDGKTIHDGTERVSGEFLAKNDRWADAVYAVGGFGNTGRFTEFLKGVRKHNPEWAKSLRALHDNLVKWIGKVPTGMLASTEVHEGTGLSPWGHRYAEEIAAMLDAVANPPKPPEDDPHDAEPSDGEGEAKARDEDGKPEIPKPEEIKRMKPPVEAGSWWDDLRVVRLPMPKAAPGGLGRKRKASPVGTSPRRMTRMLTDPDRKVFDTTRKTVGGVVLIDGSASMKFSQDDVRDILEAAPGCTVAVYCSNSKDRERPNLMVIADKGRMVAEMPERVAGNGVDGPAIRWAVDARQSSKAPVVWITDGLCHGPDQRYKDAQGVECAEVSLKNGVILRPDVETAVAMLRELRKGRKPRRWYPPAWRASWSTVRGKDLGGLVLENERMPRRH
jgi:hypothetical protein